MTIEHFESMWTPEPYSGCWLWFGSNNYRYGHCWFNGKTRAAHRVSWELYRGEIPKGGHVLHRCDTTFCVNPDHLFLGDHASNMFDMARKGRNGIAKLTPKQALAIRLSDEPRKVLRERFRVSKTTICDIKTGKLWKAI